MDHQLQSLRSSVLQCLGQENNIWQQNVHREQTQGQGQATSRPGHFETKATEFCPRGVLEDEDSPRGPHPWILLNKTLCAFSLDLHNMKLQSITIIIIIICDFSATSQVE